MVINSKLKELANLKVNWDKEGGKPIAISVLVKAQATLDASDFIPHSIVPISNGGLQFEYYGEHFDFELEFSPSGEIALLVSETKRDFQEAIEIHIPEVKNE